MAVSKPDRRHRWPLVVVIGVIALAVLVSLAAGIVIESLWYHSLGADRVYWTRLLAGIGLFLAFGVVSGAIVAANLLVASRGSQGSHIEIMGTRLPRWVLVALPAAVIGVGIGWLARTGVDIALGWLNAAPFGSVDPTFGHDISFFVFSLPWWLMVKSLLMTTLVLSGLIVGLFYLFSAQGSPVSVRATQQDGVVTPEVKITNPFDGSARSHLSVIIALVVATYGWQCLLDRYVYVYSNNGLFTGVGYTEQHARLIARLVVAIIAFICAVFFIVNTRMQRWLLSVASLVLMVVSSIVVSGLYPAVVQRVSVKPNEPARQAPFIANNIAATRAAYGIDNVQITDYSAETSTTAGQLKSDAEALPGIRLIDPYVVAPTFEQLQQVRGYYSFPNTLNVDRYDIGGQTTDVIVAAREIYQAGLPASDQTWVNIHMVYTHGFGMVAAYGNQRQPTGEPVWLAGDIPPTGHLDQQQSRIYFGQETGTFAIVGAPAGTPPVELDTPGGAAGSAAPETQNTYDGSGGVPIGSPLLRFLCALQFRDINIVLAKGVNRDSKILFDRTPLLRVQKVAPWLTVDSNPYPAIVDGRLTWILDGYTTTASYPDSQMTTLGGGDYPQSVNYVRNSVKATVDAYDGTVTLYAWDPSDPILNTWMKAYPGIVKPKADISADLLAHMRYPQDLFNTQRQILARYHVSDPYTWYQQSELWQVPADPRTGKGTEPPYYLSIKWPGDASPVFSLTAAYVPNNRNNLGAYLSVVADATSPNYGQLRALKLSDSQQIAGPSQTFNAIITDQSVSAKLLPYTQQDSTAVYANLLTLPLGGGLIYVLPIYTVGSTSSSYPLLRFVVVRFGDQIGIGDTLQQALDSVFKGDAGANTGEGTTPGSTPSTPGGTPTTPPPTKGTAAAQAYLEAAQAAFAAAQQALKNGDLATYQAQMAIAEQQVQLAAQALQ